MHNLWHYGSRFQLKRSQRLNGNLSAPNAELLQGSATALQVAQLNQNHHKPGDVAFISFEF